MSNSVEQLYGACVAAQFVDDLPIRKVARHFGLTARRLAATLDDLRALRDEVLPQWFYTLSMDAQGPNVWMYARDGRTVGGRAKTLEGAFLAALLIAHSGETKP